MIILVRLLSGVPMNPCETHSAVNNRVQNEVNIPVFWQFRIGGLQMKINPSG